MYVLIKAQVRQGAMYQKLRTNVHGDAGYTTLLRVFIQDFISGGVSKNQGFAHGYTRDSLTYLLIYFLECYCVYLF